LRTPAPPLGPNAQSGASPRPAAQCGAPRRQVVIRALARPPVGEHERALESADRAIELDGRDASAHAQRGMALLALGRHAEALAAHDRSIALDGSLAFAHHGRGHALYLLGRPGERPRS